MSFVLQRLSNSTFILSAATVGAFVAWRRPGNPIGWLLCMDALSWTGVAMSAEYGLYALVEAPGAVLGGHLFFPVAQTFHILGGQSLIYTLLLFPSGRFLGPRWSVVAWIGLVAQTLWYGGALVSPGRVQTAMFAIADNPFAIDYVPRLLTQAGFVLSVVIQALAVSSLLVRFRRARGTERQQLKWLAFGAICVAILVIPWSADVAFRLGPVLPAAQEVLPSLIIFAATLLPVAIGIALLRYRLYDIDIIINRTLVYAIVTAVLAGAFGALSVLAQRVTLAVTGQESPVAVVVAALVVTALFQPVRWRVQTLVDRRFYRTKYDASRTLQHFANRARDEVELDSLTRSLVAVVTETMQPEYVSLWLRPRPNGPITHLSERC